VWLNEPKLYEEKSRGEERGEGRRNGKHSILESHGMIL
jgi:hypothetical protein